MQSIYSMSIAHLLQSTTAGWTDVHCSSISADSHSFTDLEVTNVLEVPTLIVGSISKNTSNRIKIDNPYQYATTVPYILDYGATQTLAVTTPSGRIQFTNAGDLASGDSVQITVNYTEFSNLNSVYMCIGIETEFDVQALLHVLTSQLNPGQFRFNVSNSTSGNVQLTGLIAQYDTA